MERKEFSFWMWLVSVRIYSIDRIEMPVAQGLINHNKSFHWTMSCSQIKVWPNWLIKICKYTVYIIHTYPLNRCQIFALVAHSIKLNDVWNRLEFKFNWKWWQQVTLDNIFNHSLFSVYCEHTNDSEQCGHANDVEIGRNYGEKEFWLPNYKETR